MSISITKSPTLYGNKSINPGFNRIYYNFNSNFTGASFQAVLAITFYSNFNTPPSFTAVDGEFITINNNKIYFKDSPRYGELTSSPFSSGNQAATELYYILSEHPRFKEEYNIELIDTLGFLRVLLIAKQRTSTLNLSYSQSSLVSNVSIINTNGTGGTFGSDSWNYGNYIKLFVSKDDFKRNIHDNTVYSVTGDNEYIFLEKDFNSVINGVEQSINFTVEEFINKFINVETPFIIGISFTPFKQSLIRYHIEYGEYYSNDATSSVRKFPIGEYGKNDGINLYGHYSNLPSNINTLDGDIEDLFQKYWFRNPTNGPGTTINYDLVFPLTNIPPSYKVSPTQRLYLGFIWNYIQFSQLGSITPIMTNLILQYDVYFVDGTSVLNQYVLATAGTNNFGTIYGINIGPEFLDLNGLETLYEVLVESFTVRVREYQQGDVYTNSRPVTVDFTYQINNDLRCYRKDVEDDEDFPNNQFGELIFLNSLGFWDTHFIHNEIIKTSESSNSIYSKNIDYSKQVISDMNILKTNTVKTYSIISDSLDKETYIYLSNELVKSSEIYLRQYGSIEQVGIVECSFSNSNDVDLQQFTMKLIPMLKENKFK